MACLLVDGHEVLVDDEDLPEVSKRRWRIHVDRRNGRLYAYRQEWWKGHGKVRKIFMHREIMGCAHKDGTEVDHRDVEATLDNRRANLRIATRSQNNCNRGMRKDNTSGIKGVSADPKRQGYWKAQIMHERKGYNLGSYPTKEEAAAAYEEAAKRLHGDFARPARDFP